jgi:hypothetical protein
MSGKKRSWKKVMAGTVLVFPVFWIAGVLLMTRGPMEWYEPIPERAPHAASQDLFFKFVERQSKTSQVKLELEVIYDDPQARRPIAPNMVALWGYTKIRRWWNWYWSEKRAGGSSIFISNGEGPLYGVVEPEVMEDGILRYDFKVMMDLQGVVLTLKPRDTEASCMCVSPDDQGLSWIIYVTHSVLCPVQHYSRYNHSMQELFESSNGDSGGSIRQIKTISLAGRDNQMTRAPKQVCDALQGVKGVSKLDLTFIEVDDALSDAIVSMVDLEELTLDFVRIEDSQLARMSRHRGIKTLTVTGTNKIGSDTLIALGKWPALEGVMYTLPLGEWKVEDGALAALVRGKSMKWLNIGARVHMTGTSETGKALEKKEFRFNSRMIFVVEEGQMNKSMKAMVDKGAMTVEARDKATRH